MFACVLASGCGARSRGPFAIHLNQNNVGVDFSEVGVSGSLNTLATGRAPRVAQGPSTTTEVPGVPGGRVFCSEVAGRLSVLLVLPEDAAVATIPESVSCVFGGTRFDLPILLEDRPQSVFDKVYVPSPGDPSTPP